MKPQFSIALILTLALSAHAAEAPKTPNPKLTAALSAVAKAGRESPDFATTLQSVAALFQTVEVNTTPRKLNLQPITLNAPGQKVDAIRFRTPAGKLEDMTWVFAFTPNSVEHWYILPVEGKMKGFQNFYKLKPENVTTPEFPKKHAALAQRLPAQNLKPDTEYILWFTFPTDQPAQLQVAINFTPVERAQTPAATFKALGITEK